MTALDAFTPLLGTWQGLERQYASAFGPESAARAMIVFRSAVSGSIVVQEYRQVRADGSEFEGHGVFQADGQRILWWLFDSAGRVPVPAEGGFGDGELELTKITPRGTAIHRLRVVADVLEYRIAYGPPGTEPVPFLGGRYARISTH